MSGPEEFFALVEADLRLRHFRFNRAEFRQFDPRAARP
jgi:hypothetical protein